MLDGKKGSLSLFVARTSLVGDVAVSISFKCKISSCCILKLKGSCGCGCFPAGSEEGCVCYALYLMVKNALCGDPVATSKSKVGDVECGVNNGSFNIAWKVKGTGSAVRKSLGIALKQLNPGRAYAPYAYCVKEAGGKSDRETFNYAASEVQKSIKDGVHCGVVGNIRLMKTDPTTKKEVVALDVMDMLDVLNKKLDTSAVEGKKSAPNSAHHVACDHNDKTEVKMSGWGSFVLRDYVSSKLKGVTPSICDKYVIVPLKQSVWDTKSANMKKYVKDFVKLKYDKLKDNLGPIMGYMMFANATVSTQDVQSMIKSKITGSDVERVLNGAL